MQQQQRPSLQDKVASWLRTTAKAAAVLGVAMALVLGRCDAAQAARSAGRAGGFSAPPAASRSYGGGGGGGYSSYSGGGYTSRGGGYSGGVYSTPYSTYRAPIFVPTPMLPAPMLPGTGLMVAPTVVSTGPDIVDIAIVSMFLVMAAGAATSALRGGSDVDDEDGSGFSRPTLTRVQVGLLSLARELKGDLDRIAAAADTGSSRGLHQLLQEVVLALLRNPRYCIYGASSQKPCASTAALESAFNSASLKERSKFEAETLVNVAGGTPRRSSYRPATATGGGGGKGGGSQPDELVVVTLLVATGCKVDIPAKINSLAELQEALSAMGGLPQEQVLGVELLWTPQAEGDYFTRDEIVTDYPTLRQL